MTHGVGYRDSRKADPPNATLTALPRSGIVVFAVSYQSASKPAQRIRLRLDRATRFPCCDGTYLAGGVYELSGAGPRGAYSVIVRVYYGSRPTRMMRRQAQLAVDRLELPSP